jgi:hypothetical protein
MDVEIIVRVTSAFRPLAVEEAGTKKKTSEDMTEDFSVT